MSAKRTTKPRPRAQPGGGMADLKYLRSLTDEEIERTADSDLPIFPDSFWNNAVLVTPQPKVPISVRVDRDVLDWFRSKGPRYQSRMNAVLRSYMEQTRSSKRSTAGGRKSKTRKGA
jgi:uncharacterized protein (DUF4415 family)